MMAVSSHCRMKECGKAKDLEAQFLASAAGGKVEKAAGSRHRSMHTDWS